MPNLTTLPIIIFSMVKKSPSEDGIFKAHIIAEVPGSNWKFETVEVDGNIIINIIQNPRKHDNGRPTNLEFQSTFTTENPEQTGINIYYGEYLIANTTRFTGEPNFCIFPSLDAA